MYEFNYHRPTSIEDASKLLAENGEASLVAGGMTLLPTMKLRLAQPSDLVDLSGIDGLDGINDTGDAIEIGAMTRHADVAGSDVVRNAIPALADLADGIGDAQVRNRGTIGGSLALADPAAELPAVALALAATVHLASTNGGRDVAADDFFLGAYETAREPHELVTGVSFPVAANGDRFGFHEITRRHGDYAMAGVAVASSGGSARAAFFAIGDGAMRSAEVEAALGADLAGVDAAVEALAELQISGDLNGDEATKRHLAGVALRRAVEGARA